jgi:ammonia channel protein AmtB
LIVGSLAERMKFGAVLLFSVLWFTFAYIPIAHMVWGPGGFMLTRGALDFAGGTVVHINAGIAGLVGAYLLGPRIGIGRESMKPHNLTFTMIGASLLWVGWFGFNAGSNLEANAGAALAFINTLVATAAAVLAWLVHGIGGIVGALLTGIFTAPVLGGTGAADFSMLHQLGIQSLGVGVTLVWSGVVSLLSYLIVRVVFGGSLRVTEEDEHQGLDITTHGESAYEA